MSHKPKWNLDQIQMKSSGFIKIIMVHHPGNMNVLTEFHGVLFKMCQNVSLRMTNLKQLVGLKMVAEPHRLSHVINHAPSYLINTHST